MPTTVVKTIGSTGDYSTLASWIAACNGTVTTTRSNTALGGSSSTILLDAGASAVDSFYVGLTVTNALGQERLITGYVGATKTATIGVLNGSSATWTAPIATDAYTINSVIWQGKCQNQEFSVAGNVLTISGITTDTTRYVELTTVAGASFRDNAGATTNPLKYDATKGAAIKCTATYTVAVTISVNNTRISNLQITGTQTSCQGLIDSNSASACRITNILGHSLIRSNFYGIEAGANSAVLNCIVILTGTTGHGFRIVNGASSLIAGCTAVRTSNNSVSQNAFVSVYGSSSLKNSAGFGFTNFSTGTFAGSNNASDTTIGFGTSNQASLTYTSQFVGTTAASPDFRAVSSGNLKNGTPDLTNTPTDIIGTTRDATTPYIGCWEVVASVVSDSNRTSMPPLPILCM